MLRKKEEMKEWQRELLKEEPAPKEKVIVVTSEENEAEVNLPSEVPAEKEVPKKTPAKKTTAKKTTKKTIEKMEVKE